MCVPTIFMHSKVTDNDPSPSADADLIFNVISHSCLSIELEQNKA